MIGSGSRFLINRINMSAEIEKRIKAILYDKLGIDEKVISVQSSFKNDLGADSLDIVELIVEFERVFNITIPDNEAERLLTVGEAVIYINSHLEHRRRRMPL